MRKVVLFIAMSLDGYIADKSGGVDWLNGEDENAKSVDTYSAFIKNVDTVIMGWNTYHQVVTELSPLEWPYSGLTSYIITNRTRSSSGEIIFISKSPCELVQQLSQEKGKDIWICGGADIIHQLMQKNLIDIYYISIIPTILGNGIPLFGPIGSELKLKLVNTQTSNGITDLIYEKRA